MGEAFAFGRWCIYGMERYGKFHEWGWSCLGCRDEWFHMNAKPVRIP